MSVTIKSAREIALMKEAGRILAITHDELKKALKPGMTTWDIDHLGEEIIRSYGCIPSFLNYNGYPASICISVNDEVVHGIPSKNRVLQEGDIVQNKVSLRGLNMQNLVIISMIYLQQYRLMQKALVMA